jgi:murein DD-endopeptidase MepM/ murein hydrolase activator NlpD
MNNSPFNIINYKNEDDKVIFLTISLFIIFALFAGSIIKNLNLNNIETNLNFLNYENIDSKLFQIPQANIRQDKQSDLNGIKTQDLEYHQILGSTNEVLIHGKLHECLDKLVLDGKIEKIKADEIQTNINNFYEISKLKDSQATIKLNLDDSGISSDLFKGMILKIDNNRHIEVNDELKVRKINKLNTSLSLAYGIETLNIQNADAMQAQSLSGGTQTKISNLGNYKLIKKTVNINDNIRFLSGTPVAQLVDFRITGNKKENLILSSLLQKIGSKEEIMFFSINYRNRSINYYGKKNKSGKMEYFTRSGFGTQKVSNFCFPIGGKYVVGSQFGMRFHPILKYRRMHTGVDIRAKTGTPIYAAADGKVEFIGFKGGYGRYIMLKHNNVQKTAYGHMSSFNNLLKPGSYVKKGQIIGKVGSSGLASGPHLHYEVIERGRFTNPLNLKSSRKNTLNRAEMKDFLPQVKKIDSVLKELSNVKSAQSL